MLAKKYRLTGAESYKKVQAEGVVYQSANFGLAYLDRQDSLPSRFGVIVSTKVAKDAVDRNRIKRIISESVRNSSVDLKNGFEVVFLTKTTITRVSTSEIMKEVKEALRNINVL